MEWHELKPLQAMIAKRFFEKRFLMLMLPRQEGKTELGVRLLKSCMDDGIKTFRQTTFIAKDKESAKRAAREKFLRIFDPRQYLVNTVGVTHKINKSTNCFIQSCDVEPDRMRGGSYHLFVWTEVAFAKFQLGMTHDYVVEAIVKPTTRATRGFGFMESTANGMNGWYNLWHRADEIGFVTMVVRLSDMANMGLITRTDFDTIKAETHPDIFRQEYECEFLSFSGAVYPEFNESLIEDIPMPLDWQRVVLGIDWGFKDATCILAAYIRDGIIYIFDEIYVREKTLDEICLLLDEQKRVVWKVTNVVAVADHEPDRNEELNRRGIPTAPADKVDVLGNRLEVKEALFKRQIRVSPRCQFLIKDWKSASWDPKKTNEIDEKICTWGHYDAEAAARYLIRNLRTVEAKEPERNPHHEGGDALSAMAYEMHKQQVKGLQHGNDPW